MFARYNIMYIKCVKHYDIFYSIPLKNISILGFSESYVRYCATLFCMCRKMQTEITDEYDTYIIRTDMLRI